MTDSTRTILTSARRFFSGTILSRVTGMFRDMAMAYIFGTQASIASFMLAFRFSHLLRRLFGEGALQSAFIPEFEALRQQDQKRAFRFFRDLNVTLTLFLSVLILIGCAGLGAALAYGHFSSANQEIISLTLMMLPSLLFICLFGLNASLLQCEKSYFTPSVAPVAFNVIWIIAVFALKHMNEEQAMPWLALGVVVACFFQWLLTVPKTISILRKELAGSYWHDIKIYSRDLATLMTPLFLGIIGVAASQINNAVDALFARIAEVEGPAFLWYSIRVQQLPLALFGIAISGAILPPLSRAIKSLDWEKFHYFLSYAFRQTMNLMIPITVLLFASGDTFINFIYGRGDFNAISVGCTTKCLWAYSLGLFPTALVLILAPACYAQSNYRLPAIASFLAMGLNAVLNAWMILGMGLGAVSVAIATSISAWMNLIFLIITMRRRQAILLPWDLLIHFMRVSAWSLGSAILVTTIRTILGDTTVLSLLRGFIPDFSRNFFTQTWSVLWQIGVFSFMYGLGMFRKRILYLRLLRSN